VVPAKVQTDNSDSDKLYLCFDSSGFCLLRRRVYNKEVCMGHIRDEVLRAAQTVGATVSEIPRDEADRIREQVTQRFAGGVTASLLWEHLQERVSNRDANAWRWVGDYVKDAKAIMFFDKEDERAMFEFRNGPEVVSTLGESYHFEFYLTNRQVDYLICFNHHDYLIAGGLAADWLKEKT
jgi:hypothetical protein